MKNIVYLISVFAIVTLNSCGTTEPPQSPVEELKILKTPAFNADSAFFFIFCIFDPFVPNWLNLP